MKKFLILILGFALLLFISTRIEKNLINQKKKKKLNMQLLILNPLKILERNCIFVLLLII